MNQHSYRDTWAEVSLDAIKHNVQQFRQIEHILPTNLRVMML